MACKDDNTSACLRLPKDGIPFLVITWELVEMIQTLLYRELEGFYSF